jgi:hypothetical protein
MKRIFFGMILLICCLTLRAQQAKDEFKTMVDSAISIKYSHLIETSKSMDDNYINNLYLMDEQNQPLNYLYKPKKFKFIEVFNSRNTKIITKGIYAWKVFTNLKGNEFVINIVDFYITYKKHNYNFSNGGVSKTIFRYSCDENKWKLISSINSGI